MLSAAAIVVAGAVWLPATAQASQSITSFKTALVETGVLNHGTIAAAGVVLEEPSAAGFTIEAASGEHIGLNVFHDTVYKQVGVPSLSLSNVVSGEYVEVVGYSLSQPPQASYRAQEVLIAPATAGVVQAAPSAEGFAIETSAGTTDTVEVSPTTAYSRANPIPGEQGNPPTLSDLISGDQVDIVGTLSDTTATATRVVLLPPQAGGHPDLTTSFRLQAPGAPEAARDVVFNAPTGVFGNPRAVAQCEPADFALDTCSPNSQVGLITLRASFRGNPDYLLGTAPIFSIDPEEGETARFAFITPILGIPISIPVSVRTDADYGLRFTVKDVTQTTPLASAKLTFWGFPADPTHEAQRFPKGKPGEPTGCPEEEGTACNREPTRSSSANQPLIDNPTTCTGRQPTSTLEVETYADPSHPTEATAAYPPIEGCQNEVFEPVLQASPTTNETDSASGLNVDLKSPQFLTLAAEPSEIRSAIVTLPEGFTINPDAADGQSECRELEANFGTEGPAECPNQSKIGTFSIGTPALPERLEGSVYLGEPKPGDQYRLFMTASGFGMNVKLVGSVKPNPATGRLTAEFPNLPQAPFEDFQLHLFSGERALMATPTACTIYTVGAEFYPWNSSLAEQESTQTFGLDEGPHGTECPGQIRPFTPTLEAGTADPTAGGFSNFALKINREDGDQFLEHLNFTMPPGLTANLHGLTYCSDASIAAAANTPGRTEQADPSCPASSEIGTSNVAAGPGIHPFHATGKVYFAGPFQGAPLSLVVDYPRPRRPLRLRHRRRPHRPPYRPRRRPRHCRLPGYPRDHRRHPPPHPLDPGQHQPPQLHDQPHQLLRIPHCL